MMAQDSEGRTKRRKKTFSSASANPVVALFRRQYEQGSGPEPFQGAPLPERLRASFEALGCGSQVVLGFCANGTSIIGYSALEEDIPNGLPPRVLIQNWEIDFSTKRCSRLIHTVELPFLLRGDPLEEFLVPLSVVHNVDNLYLLTRYEQKSDDFRDVEAYVVLADESDQKYGTILRTRYAISAFDLVNQLRLIFIGNQPFQHSPASKWWRRRDQDCEDLSHVMRIFSSSSSGSVRGEENCFICCFTLDAENFLVEQLQRQLSAKLVINRSSSTIMAPRTFSILDYTIQFVRFISKYSFEFVVVAKIHVPEGKLFIGIISQVSLSAHRIINVFKAKSDEGTPTSRCHRLVQCRRQGYTNPNTIMLSNDPVIEGTPVDIMTNPVLPFEIYW